MTGAGGSGCGCGQGCGQPCCDWCGCGTGRCASVDAPTANRPGLPSLDYRVGTHGSFLTAMLDRLSSRLPDLRTRNRDDASVAFLDAAATLADVLTFYQERIANEGYLRTATERRSIIELANLVGYRARPGVAATTYLAFTLDAGYQGLVPAGTRATSLPAPGERPQSFETTAPLQARAEWNLLRPRLTRPQVLSYTLRNLRETPNSPETSAAAAASDNGTAWIYLSGTQTRLTINDPLLLAAGEASPLGYRVREVLPDPAAQRTAVRLEPWSRERYAARALQLAHAARLATLQTLDLDAHDVGRGRTVQRVVRALEPLTRRPDATWTASDVAEQVDRAVDVIRVELDQAARMGWARLETWLQEALDVFERLGTAEAPAAPAAAPISGTGQRADGAGPAFAGLSKELAKALAKPASRPPDDPARLTQTVAATYAASGDTLTRLLASTRPALGAVLYQAWDGRQLTGPSGETVFASRVRARLYGHNTPARTAEEMRMTFSDDDEELLVVNVGISGHELVLRVPPRDGTTDEPFTAADEVVSLTLSGFASELQTQRVQVRLVRRRIIVDVESRRPDRVQVSGCDPATVTLGSDSSDGESWLIVTGRIARSPTLVERAAVVSLDASYPQILPGSWMALEQLPESGPPMLQVHRVLSVADVSRDDYGVSTVSTQLVLDGPWVDPDNDTFDVIRNSTVFVQSDQLELAPMPIDPIDEAICGDRIELDGLYPGLQPGRWLVVSGERTDVPDVAGVAATELAMLAGVDHVVNGDLPGETAHTVLRLANPLAYCYRRDTAKVHGNVTPASHGETRTQVLGSGDASTSGQAFELRQRPLTYTPAATPSGVESTLQVRVDGVLWHETCSLVDSSATDRHYVTVTDDEQSTRVRFGDGIRGARLPTGVENVSAVYRTGIGPQGNLGPGRISQLATRPLGVKDVINPVGSTGGAGPEGDDVVRRNAPLGVTALDRLVSVEDHADFARTFAGIGKATATRLSDGSRQLVHVTVAGLDDIPIAPESELFSSLLQAFHRLGDPRLPVELAVRELLVTVLSAQVAVLPDYLWPLVEADVRSALVGRFGFDRRELAQDLLLSEIISAIQQTEGVAYVDVDTLAAVDEPTLLKALETQGGLTGSLGLNARINVSEARVVSSAEQSLRLRPAQLTYFDPEQPATILLTERAR